VNGNLSGSVRLDVYDTVNNIVYDYKFVMPENLPGLHQAQINMIIAQGPDLLTPSKIIEINPR
jgi:hypothetical protein